MSQQTLDPSSQEDRPAPQPANPQHSQTDSNEGSPISNPFTKVSQSLNGRQIQRTEKAEDRQVDLEKGHGAGGEGQKRQSNCEGGGG